MKRVFYNKDNRLRVIWKVLIYILLGAVAFVPFIPILKILPLDSDEAGPASSVNLVFVLFLNISFVLAAWITLKWIDRKPAALLGLNFWPSGLKELFIGVGLGAANLGIVFLILFAFGWVSVEWAGFAALDWKLFLFYLATYLVFASFEEIINRGYIFQALCEGIGPVATAIVISLIFSIVHILNPDFSVLAAVFLFIHGLLYAVAYLKTRSLWTPIGLHLAWNFAQGPIAGIRVSGTPINNSLFLTELSGPEVMTGGSFGAEGGLVAIVISAIILIIVLKVRWLKPSGRFIAIEKVWVTKSRAEDA